MDPNKVFLIVVIVLQVAISYVAAVDYLVGDENGWTINTDYRAWAKDKIFLVGDRLVFQYTAGADNVVRVKRNAYRNCMGNPTSKALSSGNDVIELTKPGRKWFISSVGDQCSVGNQKLAINVFPSSYFSRKSFFFPSVAPAPSPNYGFIWKLFFPPSVAPAPAPSSGFPWWRLLFPPSAAPSPAPSFDFPWKIFFPPAPAPAPTNPFPWKWWFPQPPAPAPTSPFPWKWLFPPTPAPAPTMDFQEEGDVSTDE